MIRRVGSVSHNIQENQNLIYKSMFLDSLRYYSFNRNNEYDENWVNFIVVYVILVIMIK